MAKEQFVSGDVVRLKSGSPAMTVTYVNADEYGTTVNVAWFDDKLQPHAGHYPAEALEKS